MADLSSASEAHRHTQFGKQILLIVFVAWLPSVIPLLTLPDQAGQIVVILTTVLLGGVAYLFSSLTVSVTEDEIVWWFGPGLWTHRQSLDEVTDVETNTCSFWEGWGIRHTPSGRLYNVSGYDVVAIHLQDGTQFRLGTDEPDALRNAIARQIPSRV